MFYRLFGGISKEESQKPLDCGDVSIQRLKEIIDNEYSDDEEKKQFGCIGQILLKKFSKKEKISDVATFVDSEVDDGMNLLMYAIHKRNEYRKTEKYKKLLSENKIIYDSVDRLLHLYDVRFNFAVDRIISEINGKTAIDYVDKTDHILLEKIYKIDPSQRPKGGKSKKRRNKKTLRKRRRSKKNILTK